MIWVRINQPTANDMVKAANKANEASERERIADTKAIDDARYLASQAEKDAIAVADRQWMDSFPQFAISRIRDAAHRGLFCVEVPVGNFDDVGRLLRNPAWCAAFEKQLAGQGFRAYFDDGRGMDNCYHMPPCLKVSWAAQAK